jgi:cell wall-associated NlpC family hydrolase
MSRLLEIDEDPALALFEKLSPDELEAAANRANYGDADPRTLSRPSFAPERAGPSPVMPLAVAQAEAFLRACMTASPRVTYGLGAKVPFFRARPGIDFTKVDCSGFVREAIREATTPMVRFPDGSVVQHDWVRSEGYRQTTIAAGRLVDGKTRIAFLSPHDTSSGIGHVVLIHNGKTFESHGGVGPDTRPWDGAGWQARSRVYELT